MDIDLSATDLAFRDEVRDFLRTNAYKPGADYTEWRDGWFAKAKAKGGWDVPKLRCCKDSRRSRRRL